MSPDSQRLEIECLQNNLAEWFVKRPDFHDRILALVSVWLHPAMTSLDMSASQLKSVLESAPDGQTILTWLAEEALGYPYEGTTLFEQYTQGAGRKDSGLYLRFLRRMTKSKTALWRVIEKSSASTFSVKSASGNGPSYTIHNRILNMDINERDVLMSRLIDMPAGPILGQAVVNIGPVEDTVADLTAERVQHLVSAFASMFVRSATTTDSTGPQASGTGHPQSNKTPFQHNPETTRHSDPPTAKPQAHNGAQPDDARNNTSGAQGRNQPADKQEAPPLKDGAERERLLERVRKLFAMAQQSDASPHEAEIALRRCQSLMSKYGINEADLHTSEFGSAEFTKGRTIPSHVKFLASAVAKLHDVLFVRGENGFAEFRGFDVDAKVARLTLEYLIEAVERALANRKRAGDFPAGRSAAYDYRLGFSTQVNERVRAIVKERKAAEQATAGSGRSLTVRKMEIVDRECGHDLRNASFSSSRGARNAAAHAAGIDDGSNVSLDQQVGGSAPPLALPKN